ncbi:MAG: NPCBM/NEW2 domain-containing protein [Clostridia bacterium]|nr:NPCBM/NEW2 domain-containing protein [Clostridia bacterium]
MKRILLTALICILTLVMFAIPVCAANDITVMLDNNKISFDVKPQIIDNRTMVPIRAIFEELGATVSWNESTRTATAVIDDYVVKCTVGSKILTVNGVNHQMDTSPVIISNRTLMPARFAAEAFGAEVKWNASTRTAYITSAYNRTFSTGTPCTSNHSFNSLGYCTKCGSRSNHTMIDVTDYIVYIGAGGAEKRTIPFALEKVHGYYNAGDEVRVIAHVKNFYGGLWYMVAKDGSRSLVYSGDVANSSFLNSLTPTYAYDGEFKYEAEINDNLKNGHLHAMGVNSRNYQTYNLGGKYTRLTGSYFMSYDEKDFNTSNTPLYIYGDDKLIYEADMQGEMFPIIFSVDVTGVKTLKIEIRDGYTGPHTFFGDCRLWSMPTNDSTGTYTITSKLTTDVPDRWLKDVEPYFCYYASGLDYEVSRTDNYGNSHKYAFGATERNYNSYFVNGNYSKLTGVLFMDAEDRDYNHTTSFKVYGDDKLLYSASIKGGDAPINVSVDISGVKSLRVEMHDGYTGPHAYFGDAAIFK